MTAYRILSIALHVLVSIYTLINDLIVYGSFRFVHFVNSFAKNCGHEEIQFLDRCKKDLTKIPKHLSVIIGTNRIDAEILSKIAVFALISDIDYISYYDIKGDFTLDRAGIPKYIETRKMPNGRFLWSMPNDRRKSTGQLRYKNGLDKSIEVIVLSVNDGKPLLAEVCRDLWINKTESHVKEAIGCKDILAEKITSALNKRLDNLPDPDLAIIFDKTMCTYGLLPWHTRFTEFHCIKTGNCFDVKSFANVLYKFSKCEQRFGK